MTDDNTVLPTSGNLVIIGNGMVGHHLVKTLVEQGDASPWTIHVFAGENRPAYDRVHLSALFDDQTPEDLCLSPAQWYRDNRVTLHLNDEVVEIDRDNKTVITAGGVRQDYDALVLATGSYPFVPPIPGHEHENWCTAPWTTWTRSNAAPATPNAAWWWEAACSGWKPPTRCGCWGWKPMWWNSRRN